VLSVFDARVCRGELDQSERRLWRNVVATLQSPWERPPPEVIVSDVTSICASLESGGESSACRFDGGVRGRASRMAHELRRRLEDEADCEPAPGPVVLSTSWSASRETGDSIEYLGLVEVEWRDGSARMRTMDPVLGDWQTCAAPTEEQSLSMDRLAFSARDALVLPRPSRFDLDTRDIPRTGELGFSQLVFIHVTAGSPYGPRGSRLLRAPEIYGEAAVTLADLCGFATED